MVAGPARMPHAGGRHHRFRVSPSGQRDGAEPVYKADRRDLRDLMIDPKMLEMSVYQGIPHLLAPVVTDMKEAANGLRWCVVEMDRALQADERVWAWQPGRLQQEGE